MLSSDRSNDSRLRNGRSGGPARESAPSHNLSAAKSSSTVDTHNENASVSGITRAAAGDDHRSVDSTQLASEYASDLAQKDELIAALVQELEQAVEQLDRFERSGAERSHGGRSSSNQNIAQDSRVSQSSDLDDLRRMAEDWEETKPGALLMRIESQLAAVHDLVLNLKRDDHPRPEPAEIDDRIRRLYRETDQTIDHEATDVTIDESASSWESIKQQILGGDAPAPPSSTEAEDSELLRLMSETPAPADIDLNTADIDALRIALVQRDAYIIQLNRLYRTRNTLSIPTNWAALANVPAEMQIRVDTLVQRLDVQVRLGEVEMSLERARLARERSQIQSEREQIEKHLRRLGLSSIAELNNISAATGNTSDRRWMRFLGPNTK